MSSSESGGWILIIHNYLMTIKQKKEYKEYKKIEALLKKSSKEVDRLLKKRELK